MPRPSPETLSAQLLDAARQAGAEAADALVLSDRSVTVEVRGGALEQAERAEGVDLGLRVLVGRRQACVSSSDPRAETIAEMAERAVAMAREAPEDPFAGLAEPSELAADRSAEALDLADPDPEPAPEALQDDAARAEAAALAVEGVSQVQAASASWGARDMQLAATNGFSAGYRRTSRSLSCVAIAGEGLGMELGRSDIGVDRHPLVVELEPALSIGHRLILVVRKLC